MRIITIGREFGSGGRELGKMLADTLGIPFYDKEILYEVAKLQNISLEHMERISQADASKVYSSTIARSFNSAVYFNKTAFQTFIIEQEVIKKLASCGDCVFVGRYADVVLVDLKPFNIFVYADKETKIKRCRERDSEFKDEKTILKKMQKIDRVRATNRRIMTDSEWGKKDNYHLCINTSGMNIKDIVPLVCEYIKTWFNNNGN